MNQRVTSTSKDPTCGAPRFRSVMLAGVMLSALAVSINPVMARNPGAHAAHAAQRAAAHAAHAAKRAAAHAAREARHEARKARRAAAAAAAQ